MTHHPRRSPIDGRRRLQLHAETAARMAAIRHAAGPRPRDPRIVTVPTLIVRVRAQTELNARDRADRLKDGPGGVKASTYEQARARYRTQNYYRGQDSDSTGGPLTLAQKRQLRRKYSTGLTEGAR